MKNWKSLVKSNPTEWLLEKNNPSVRYFTFRDILGKSANNPEVTEAQQSIMEKGVVPVILAKQEKEEYWGASQRFYTDKYKGTVWQLLILAELGADGKDTRILNACEFILENSQDWDSGGFAMSRSVKKGGGRPSEVIPCLTGNMIYSLIRLGYLNDPRVEQGIRWITTYQRYDDGLQKTPNGWPYERLKKSCLGKHTCHMGALKALKALAEIPPHKRSGDTKDMIKKGAEYFLLHHIYKRSHDLGRIAKPGWLKFGFPLMYQTDALEILGILTRLGYSDKRMQDAINLVISKQDNTGRWMLENTYNGRFQVNIEHKGKPSKWVTLNALRVLKQLHES